MYLTDKDLETISELAMIDSENKVLLGKEVSQIMDFVETLKHMPTEGVKPLYHPFDMNQPLRKDEPSEQSLIEELEAIAPVFEHGLYVVPSVISLDE